ncbi:MAG: S-formylglutathione hydrolase [Kangiellaceae bacterium]|jgi:S-formylglutathione hydrolase|nr:S-formylglutathione hydrolase [Kangiellaceae bacterium]
MLETLSENRVFTGWHRQYSHYSETTNCSMRFAVYAPDSAQNKRLPVLYWLSGLTCTDENFMQKAGALKTAAELEIILVAPDTSPRGDNVADDPDQAYDLGLGAGFYLNATQQPWQNNYQMYSYVVDELPKIIESNFNVTNKKAIAGHSMGGHGALTIALKNPNAYTSASAFSPICHPSQCPWGKKAFTAYLGDDQSSWLEYDTVSLLESFDKLPFPIRVDQGMADSFLDEQLRLSDLESLNQVNNLGIEIHKHDHYDHSYYFISSFIEQQLRFHATHLK